MDDSRLIVSASPHITSDVTTGRLMGNVCVALLPTLLASALIFGPRVLLVVGVTVFACVVFEYLYCVMMKKDIPVGDLSAVVTGLLLAYNLPATIPLWMAIVGAFVAIVIAKQLFGGIGFNFANPAIVGRIVLSLSFATRMTSYIYPRTSVDALSSATPLQVDFGADVPYWELFLGTHGGVLGETCALTLLLGGLYLIATKVISPMIPASYIGTVVIMSLIFKQDILYQLLSGGLLLGAFFMATDYVTSPFTERGKLVYGIGLGIITCGIRFFGTSAEGVSYAILLMNILVPYINVLTRQKVLGAKRRARKTAGGAAK